MPLYSNPYRRYTIVIHSFDTYDILLYDEYIMILNALQHASTRDLLHNFTKFKKGNFLTIIMSGSKPCGIFLPFDEGIFGFLQRFVKKTPSQKRAEKALAEYERGDVVSLEELEEKYD